MKESEAMNKYGLKNFKEILAKQYEYLDQIDFEPYIKKYEDLDELWNKVEDDFDGTDLSNNDFLEGWIFNWINHYELKSYLEKRYKIKYYAEEVVKYYRA